jgi:hypothetical protein
MSTKKVNKDNIYLGINQQNFYTGFTSNHAFTHYTFSTYHTYVIESAVCKLGLSFTDCR